MSTLDELVDAWLEIPGEGMLAAAANPPDRQLDAELGLVRLTELTSALTASGHELGSWDEVSWERQFAKLGIPAEMTLAALELLASEGMADDFVWERQPFAD